jgi:endonuclease-3
MKTDVQDKETAARAMEIWNILKKKYPTTRPLLDFTTPFELLVATMLAAQCTDERVNMVTPRLFKAYPDPHTLAQASQDTLEEIIRSTGFFRQKAKSLKNMAMKLMENFQGKVPETIDELASLPGVGRKTGNVVAGICFHIPAIIVDTHFKRVVLRLGLTTVTNPNKIEIEIRGLIPDNIQTRFSMVLNFHGRYCCKSRKPLCPACELDYLCPFEEKRT